MINKSPSLVTMVLLAMAIIVTFVVWIWLVAIFVTAMITIVMVIMIIVMVVISIAMAMIFIIAILIVWMIEVIVFVFTLAFRKHWPMLSIALEFIIIEFNFIRIHLRGVVVSHKGIIRQVFMELMVFVAIEVSIGVFAPCHAPELLQILYTIFLT